MDNIHVDSYVTGSDGNIYYDPHDLEYTGSLFHVSFSQFDWTLDDEEDELEWYPGPLVSGSDNSQLEVRFSTEWYDPTTHVGKIWVYDMNDAEKTWISGSQYYIETIVESNL